MFVPFFLHVTYHGFTHYHQLGNETVTVRVCVCLNSNFKAPGTLSSITLPTSLSVNILLLGPAQKLIIHFNFSVSESSYMIFHSLLVTLPGTV